MSTKANHPDGGQSSVPPKPPGHDQLPPWKKAGGTFGRFVKRDPQLAPLAVITLGTVGLYLYFHQSKVSEVANPNTHSKPHKDIKASGKDASSSPPVVPGDPHAKAKGSYYAESGSAPGGVTSLLYPHLDKEERVNLENVTVPANQGAFGRTIKQAAVADQLKKNKDAEESYKRGI
ncbi:hypothetical protein PHBOTO_003008 [Pseudozyma hubeiensis]|nr:hypothetical protein PHBOTO_003008 [Pseudozyma hubeiensis]